MHFSAKALTKRLLPALCLTLLCAASCAPKKSHPLIAAPNFELKDLAGKRVSLHDYRGKPVLLDFWATWCGPCRMSIPLVQEFYANHKAEGLVVLGLNMDDDLSGVFRFVQHYKMTYPVLFAGNSTAPADYEVSGLPYFVFIDPKGNVVQVYEGFSPDMVHLWEENLKTALAQKT